MFFADPISSRSLVDSGKLKVLGIADKARLDIFPNAPKMIERGFTDFEVVIYSGLWVPAKTDAAIVA